MSEAREQADRCGTCKQWETTDERRSGWGRCALAGSDFGEPDAPTSLAVAEDFESYRAVLSTSADFGCVQHEPRPPAPVPPEGAP